ncbi:GNAT family N-acetyltransferase [Utexia brackfieldae]|uniref:GNAT family N-acetyltransferase n=1 Tax=Utexia brackfieldae TaxID=3074108 RepID=UPI00370D40F1
MLTITRLTHQDTLALDQINHLYDSAFPLHEQRSNQGRQTIILCEDYYLYRFTEQGKFIGFIGSWQMGNFFYVEHFAISAELRGQGYGQQALKLFSQQAKQIILEIDPVIDVVSQKRLHFYQHCGFKHNPYQHFHPSYHPEYKPHQLEILSLPNLIDQRTYQQFKARLYDRVMQPALL